MATVSCPVVKPGPYRVTTSELLTHVDQIYQDDPVRAAFIRRLADSNGVDTRYFLRPAEQILGKSNLVVDSKAAFKGLSELAADAAAHALSQSGLHARDVTCLIVTSVSGWAMPGIDRYVIESLGLRRTVRRIPVAQIGCAGAAWGLARARDLLLAYPEEVILVVCADGFDTGVHQESKTSAEAVWMSLASGGSAACLVREDPDLAGFRIVDSFDLLVPSDAYTLDLDLIGWHFLSDKEQAIAALKESMAEVDAWLGHGPQAWPRDVAVVHPGGRAILHQVAQSLDLDEHQLRHSFRSLAEQGNPSSPAVFDVLRRHCEEPSADGTRGFLIGLGPGFTTAAVKIERTNGTVAAR